MNRSQQDRSVPMSRERAHEGKAAPGMDLSTVQAEPGYMSDPEVEAKLKEMFPPPPPLTLEDRLRRWTSSLSRERLEAEVVSLWKKAHKKRRAVVKLTAMLNQEVVESDRLQEQLDGVRMDFSTQPEEEGQR